MIISDIPNIWPLSTPSPPSNHSPDHSPHQCHQPGAGGGEFKYLRGFDPYLVSSVHHFRSPILGQAVGDFLRQERDRNQATADYLVANSAVAGTGTGTGTPGNYVKVSAAEEGGLEDDEGWCDVGQGRMRRITEKSRAERTDVSHVHNVVTWWWLIFSVCSYVHVSFLCTCSITHRTCCRWHSSNYDQSVRQKDRKADRQAGSQRISHIVYILEVVSYMFVVELYHPYTIVPFIFNK